MKNMEDEKQVKVETVSIEQTAPAPEVSTPEVNESDAKIAEMETKLADLNDKYLRVAAELENTRRRAAIDAEARARSRAMSVMDKILPIIDAVRAAQKHSPEDEGIKSLALAIESAFQDIGVRQIETVGAQLNPMLHNAIQVAEASKDTPSGTIVEEMQAGYMFGENVLRTAMVVVAK